MEVAIVTTPTLISSELQLSILLAPQCITTDLIDFGNTIWLIRHKTFSIRSPPITRLTVFYCKMKFSIPLDSVWDQLRLNHQSPPRKHRISSIILFGDNVFQSNQFWISCNKYKLYKTSTKERMKTIKKRQRLVRFTNPFRIENVTS